MWGIWPAAVKPEDVPNEPFEIEMMGCGLFGCRKDSWLGFHKDCIGFGGVEGIIHEKYRKHGRKVLCLPFLKWVHKFGRGSYPLYEDDRIRNFLLGFEEVGLDNSIIHDHYGKDKVSAIAEKLKRQRLAK